MPDLKLDPADKLHVRQIAMFEVEKEDVFHLKNLYKLIYDWFRINKLTSLENDEWPETLYMQRVLGNGNLENHIWWRFHANHFKSNYYKYFIKFDYQTLNMGTSEMTHKGKKVKTNKGDVILRCTTYLMLDYNREWRDHPFLSFFEPFFIKRIMKHRVEELRTDLWVLTYKLQDTIKQYLKMKSPYEMTKPFHPELGV